MLAGYTTAYQVFLLGLVVPIWLNMYQRASDGEAFLPSVTRHLGNFTLQVAHRPVLIALAIGLFFSFLILKRIRFTELALVVAAVLLVETVVVMSIMCLPIFSLTSLIQ